MNCRNDKPAIKPSRNGRCDAATVITDNTLAAWEYKMDMIFLSDLWMTLE
jgi:hypothetical protein